MNLKRIVAAGVVLSNFLIAGGCSEYRSDGGIVARAEDHVMSAPNREWQTYRAAVFLMLVSSVAAAELKDVNSVASYLRAAQAVNDDINNLAGHLYPQYAWYKWNWHPDSQKKQWVSPDQQSVPIAVDLQTNPFSNDPPQPPTAPGAAVATFDTGKLPTLSKINGTYPLLPCPSFDTVAAASRTLSPCGMNQLGVQDTSPYRYRNYVGMFNDDIAQLYDHLFKAAAAAIRMDKFQSLVNDMDHGAVVGGNIDLLWNGLKDLLDIAGETADAESHFAGSWRAELDNSAAIVDPSFMASRENSVDFQKCTNATADGCHWTVTTESIWASWQTKRNTRDTPVPAAAFNPIYVAIRRACHALVGLLPASDATGISKQTPTQGDFDCSSFMFAPNVYRSDYQ
jgi:hypothetical protein